MLIQSSGLANRVNRAFPNLAPPGAVDPWFSGPHFRNCYGHSPLPRSGLPDLGASNRGNHPISLWPLPCSAGRPLCFSEFRQPEAALACAPVAGRLLRPGAHCVLCPPPRRFSASLPTDFWPAVFITGPVSPSPRPAAPPLHARSAAPASPAHEIGPEASTSPPCPHRPQGHCAPRSAVGSPSACARQYLPAPWRLLSADRPAGWAKRCRSL